MGKFHIYAQRLDEAFKEAREQYAKSFSSLQEAQKKFDDAQKWHSGESPEERALSVAKAKIALTEAKQTFESTGPTIWANFTQQRAQIKKELESAVKEDGTASPDAVDTNALELLKSGIMTASDYISMVERFNDNATMTRMISKFARDAASGTDDLREKAALNAIAVTCADGLNSTMRAWDDLSRIADHCSGQFRKGAAERPEHIINMGAHWEDLSADALERF